MSSLFIFLKSIFNLIWGYNNHDICINSLNLLLSNFTLHAVLYKWYKYGLSVDFGVKQIKGLLIHIDSIEVVVYLGSDYFLLSKTTGIQAASFTHCAS